MTAEASAAWTAAAIGLGINLVFVGVMWGSLLGRMKLIEYRLMALETALGLPTAYHVHQRHRDIE